MSAQDIFDEIAKGIVGDPNLVNTIKAIYHFKIGDKSWAVDLKNAPGSVKNAAPATADVTITIAEPEFIDLMTGKQNGQKLFMAGKLKIQGNCN